MKKHDASKYHNGLVWNIEDFIEFAVLGATFWNDLYERVVNFNLKR